nr:retrovirus-related Pol polyprotein from transposon TNT 1-94 [Tanacetum cinerariifolium]
MSKKQDCTAMSSAEAEYVALSASCAQVMWMRTQLKDYGFNYNKIPLYCDSQTEYQLAYMFTKALPEDRFQYLVRRIVRLAPRKNPSGLNNFTSRAKGMHIFVGNFTYVSDFMIIEDISSVTDPKVSHVVFGKLFVELSGMTYDSSLGVVRLTNRNEEIAYKMSHKIEEYDSLLKDEKENMKSVYLRNDEDKKKGVEYVMSKM